MYYRIFVDFIRQDHITLSDEQVDQFIEADFAEWFKNYVSQHDMIVLLYTHFLVDDILYSNLLVLI